MIGVWSDGQRAGVLDRLGARGSTFAYDPKAPLERSISLTMPVRTPSWDTGYGLAPIFEMNLPEGALRARLNRQFAKATGAFDDIDLLGVVGRSQIGRIRYSGIDEELANDVPFQSVDEILRARRDGGLFDYLMGRFAAHSGLSGVQPKVLIRDEQVEPRQSPSVRGATHIVKLWEASEFPELAANEFFCLRAARQLGLNVPKFSLSDDGAALVIDRFDLTDSGYLGFEDFCVLNAYRTDQKYFGGYETALFKRIKQFVSPSQEAAALLAAYRLFVLNCAIRNGDAHLKNFGVTYRDIQGITELAPVYDLVTTWVYVPDDSMALTLNGSTRWPDPKALKKLGQLRIGLTSPQVAEVFEAVADALSDTLPGLRHYFRNSRAAEIGERISAAWEHGIRHSLGLGSPT